MAANIIFTPKNAPAWVQSYQTYTKPDLQEFWSAEMGRIGTLMHGLKYEIVEVQELRECGNCGHYVFPPEDRRGIRPDIGACPDIMKDRVNEHDHCEEWTAKIAEED